MSTPSTPCVSYGTTEPLEERLNRIEESRKAHMEAQTETAEEVHKFGDNKVKFEVTTYIVKNQTEQEAQNMRQFESGAVLSRDADHARYDLIPRSALELMARTLKTGAEKYGEYNWQKGIPNGDLMNHCLQHIYKWLAGDRSEDHIGHALCNLAFLSHFNFEEIDKIYNCHEPQN